MYFGTELIGNYIDRLKNRKIRSLKIPDYSKFMITVLDILEKNVKYIM